MSALSVLDEERSQLDFKLTDLAGKAWRLSELRGKVVLVNFWATWCPPCRKEIPDLDVLYGRFAPKGLVILGITDEDSTKVASFIQRQEISYPVLLDPNRGVNQLFAIRGIPKSFVYDRSGKLVAQAIDMRTRQQFLAMLSKAGSD